MVNKKHKGKTFRQAQALWLSIPPKWRWPTLGALLVAAIVVFAAISSFLPEDHGAAKASIADGFTWWARGSEEPLTQIPALPHSFAWPVSTGDVSSPYGKRDGKWHTGLDIRAPMGHRIQAAAAGTVVYSGAGEAGYGNTVIIDHGDEVMTLYSHNKRNVYRAGTTVRRGEVIAYVGNTGTATGYHLHFEIRHKGRPMDPAKLLPPLGSGK
ncbi:MAG: M23 family metallopeptidase [Nitrospinota bacterium]|nr:M23 family metallopeptidase [Nitrospinota bacterium]MDH5679062.1 M23 family metallopeptidase [Nitrospinota bacterium]